MHVYVFTLGIPQRPEESHIPWKRSYEWLWAFMWVLGTCPLQNSNCSLFLGYLSSPYFYTSKCLSKIKTIFIVGENYKKPKSECANHLLRTLPLLHHSGKVGSCGVLSSLERQKFLLSGPCRESATCLSRGPQTGGKTAWQFPRWLHNTITC